MRRRRSSFRCPISAFARIIIIIHSINGQKQHKNTGIYNIRLAGGLKPPRPSRGSAPRLPLGASPLDTHLGCHVSQPTPPVILSAAYVNRGESHCKTCKYLAPPRKISHDNYLNTWRRASRAPVYRGRRHGSLFTRGHEIFAMFAMS